MDPTKDLPKHQRDLIEEFLCAYNTIDKNLRQRLNVDRKLSFVQIVKDFSREHPAWLNVDLLDTAAEVRNFLVHGQRTPHEPLVVPAQGLVDQMKTACQKLTDPEKVVPRFQRPVESVMPKDSLAQVLKRIAECGYSQFPIYNGTAFQGLLTENGITRWLAHHVARKLSLIELEEIPVNEVFHEEEQRLNWSFVPRNEPVITVRELFSTLDLLEAVLITQSGTRKEKLLGIITRWDILKT
jgi:predicted transcriptional regulator